MALDEPELSPRELALKASGCDQAKVAHKPRLLSDKGSSYTSGDLAEWLDDRCMVVTWRIAPSISSWCRRGASRMHRQLATPDPATGTSAETLPASNAGKTIL